MSLLIKGAFGLVGQIKGRDGVAPVPPVTGPTGSLLWTLDGGGSSYSGQVGYDVQIKGDYIAVGAPGRQSVYVYNISSNTYLYQLTGTTAAYGQWVGLDDTHIIVGDWIANQAYIYNLASGNLVRTITNNQSQFGISVAISGNYALIGAANAGAGNTGSAYIYDVTTGALLHTLNNPTPAGSDSFGCAVDISGNYALIGARYDDTGATNTGSAYIYDVTTGALLHTLNNPTPEAGDLFGERLSISGNRAVVSAHYDNTGAINAGSVYVFDVTSGSLLNTIHNPYPEYDDAFGYDVSVSGEIAAIGAYKDNTGALNAGCVHIYNISTGQLLSTINNPTPAQNDFFGASVSIDGSNVVIGAMKDINGSIDAGLAYIYN